KETIADYVLPYINLHSAEEELSLDDIMPDNIEEVEKYKDLLDQAEKSNSRQVVTINKLTKELVVKKSEVEELVTENKKSLDLLKEKDGAITRHLKTIEKLEKEIEKLKSQKSELDIQVKEKEKIIKDLNSKNNPKTPAKKTTRGRGKTKKTAEDIDIDDVLKEGLGE
ncbi:hypothetical protein, partial [Sebaldella sp. S0638]|uniref:hypothetical protein n=1 Tax=Sebaldella sp. S0638 TaxID=2957809 RepID=UPI0020A02DF1